MVTDLEGCITTLLVYLVLLASLCLLQPGPHHVVDSSYAVVKVSSSWVQAKSLQKIRGLRCFLAIGHVKGEYPILSLTVKLITNSTAGNTDTQVPLCSLSTAQTHYITVLFALSIYPSVSGWYADEKMTFVPIKAQSACQKCKVKCVSRSCKTDFGMLKWRTTWSKNKEATTGAVRPPSPPTKRTRDKACQLRKFVDSHKQTSVSMTNGQRTDKIHGPLFKFTLWDRKRLQ